MALYDQQNNQTPWYGQQPVNYAQTRPMTQVPNAQTYAQQPVQQASQISQFAFITVPACCCYEISVKNVSESATPATVPAPPIDVQNANLEVTRIA